MKRLVYAVQYLVPSKGSTPPCESPAAMQQRKFTLASRKRWIPEQSQTRACGVPSTGLEIIGKVSNNCRCSLCCTQVDAQNHL